MINVEIFFYLKVSLYLDYSQFYLYVNMIVLFVFNIKFIGMMFLEIMWNFFFFFYESFQCVMYCLCVIGKKIMLYIFQFLQMFLCIKESFFEFLEKEGVLQFENVYFFYFKIQFQVYRLNSINVNCLISIQSIYKFFVFYMKIFGFI